MNTQRKLYKLGVGAGLAIMVLGALMAIAPVAGAEHNPNHPRNPAGNNGTVKIDGVDPLDGHGHGPGPNEAGQHPDNDPHVECTFELEFFGFDTDQQAQITFTSHAPTGGGEVLLSERKLISTDSAGPADGVNPDQDAVLPYDLTDELRTIPPHPKHGWHVKVTLTLYNADGTPVPGGQKHKVFWIEPCVPPGVLPQPSAALNVQKVVSPTPTATPLPSFQFTGPDGRTFTLAHDQTQPFVLPPGTYTVTETDSAGYDLHDVACSTDGGESRGADVAQGTEVTLADGDVVTCVFTNVPEAAIPRTGGLVVSKVAGANAPTRSPTFTFQVECAGVDLDLASDDATHSEFPLTFGASKPFSGLPAGTQCTVAETVTGGATGTTHTVNGGPSSAAATASVVIPDGPNATVEFTNNFPGQTGSANLSDAIEIDKLNDADGVGGFSDVETAEEAGDSVVFQIAIENTGDVALVLQSLTDSVPGRSAPIDLLGGGVLDCSSGVTDLRVGSILPPGSVTVCTFELDDYAPAAGDSLTNTVGIVTDRAQDDDTSTVETEEVGVEVLPSPPVENLPATTPMPRAPAGPPALTPPVLTPSVGTPPQVLPQVVPQAMPDTVRVRGDSVTRPEVRGDVVTRPLARTGGDSGNLAAMGAFLLALGAVMVLGSRRQLARR